MLLENLYCEGSKGQHMYWTSREPASFDILPLRMTHMAIRFYNKVMHHLNRFGVHQAEMLLHYNAFGEILVN